MDNATLGTTVDDSALLAFARSWFAYGGGPGELILANFGMATSEYFTRLRAALDGSVLGVEDPRLHEVLIAVCRRRLWLGA